MSKPNFPTELHVIRENLANDEPYLRVLAGGVFDVEESQPCAIYKLVSVGRIQVDRRFVESRKA